MEGVRLSMGAQTRPTSLGFFGQPTIFTLIVVIQFHSSDGLHNGIFFKAVIIHVDYRYT